MKKEVKDQHYWMKLLREISKKQEFLKNKTLK